MIKIRKLKSVMSKKKDFMVIYGILSFFARTYEKRHFQTFSHKNIENLISVC